MPKIVPVPLTRPWYPRRGEHPRQPVQRHRLRTLPRPRNPPGAEQARLVLFGPRAGELQRGPRRHPRARACATSRSSRRRRRRRTRRSGTRNGGWTATATHGRKSTSRSSPGIPRSFRSDSRENRTRITASQERNTMALKFGKLFGDDKGKPARGRPRHAHDAGQDGPGGARRATTRSATVSIMEQLRTATRQHGDAAEAAADRPPARRQAVPDARRADGDVPAVRGADGVPRRTPVGAGRGGVGDGHRNADALAAARARQRARGAGPGRGVRGGARAAASSSRPTSTPCSTAALTRGVNLDMAQDDATVKILNDVKARWDRVDKAADEPRCRTKPA